MSSENFARSTVSRARRSTISSVSSVMLSALYIFSNCRSSSCSYSSAILGHFQLEGDRLLIERLGHVEEELPVFLGHAGRPLADLQLQRHGLLQRLQLVLALMDRRLRDLQVGPQIGDRPVELVGLQFQEHVPLADRGAVRRRALDHQRGPFLGL